MSEGVDMPRMRVPPNSLEAEQAMLGALLIDASRIAAVQAVVSADDLYRAEHRRIFSGLSAMARSGKEIDVLTAHEAFGDEQITLSYLNGLAQAAPGVHAARYAQIVADRAAERRLIALTDDALAIAWSDLAIDAKSDKIAGLLAGVDRKTVGKSPVLMADAVLERTHHLDELSRGRRKAGWPLGLPGLDRMLGGGLRPGGVYVIAARPSVGKSSLAQQFALKTAQSGHTTLLLSQEMPIGELADRTLAHVGRVDYGRITLGELDRDWGAILEVAETLRDVPLWADDEESLTLRKVAAKARSVRGLRVLVVDYLQLMQSDGKSDANRNAEIEAISRGMKALAKQLGIAVILLSQLNRQVEQRAVKRPGCADLRDSGAIEQDADVVMLLWTHRELEGGARIVGVNVDKNRQGRKGDLALHFEGALQRWAESTENLNAAPDPGAAKPKGRSL